MEPLKGEHLAGAWTVPNQGVLKNLPIYSIPPDALYDSLNVLVRGGVLARRPGLTAFSAFTFPNVVTGAFAGVQNGAPAFQSDAFQNDAFQVTSTRGQPVIFAGTLTKLYGYWGGAWNDLTGAALTATSITDPVRFTGIKLGSAGDYHVLATNGVDNPRGWNATVGSGTFSDLSGSPVKFTDWATISQHVVGIRPPYDVYWSDNASISSWPALNYWALGDTPDPVIAIRAIGTQGGVVYKSRSLWLVSPQGGPEATYFFFVGPILVDGPCSNRAVVDANGPHVYMTDTGRIGSWNGAQHQWIADGIWPVVNADIDSANANRAFGWYEPYYKEVWFAYPRTGDGGDCKGGVVVVLPRPQDGITEPIGFPVRFTRAITCATDLGLSTRKAIVWEQPSLTDYTLEGQFDPAETAITGHWQTGLEGAKTLTAGIFNRPAADVFAVDSVETYVRRAVGNGSVTVQAVYSHILDTEGGTLSGNAKTVDLASSTVTEFKGQDVRGRFFGLRYGFTSGPLTLAWLGARLAASMRKG